MKISLKLVPQTKDALSYEILVDKVSYHKSTANQDVCHFEFEANDTQVTKHLFEITISGKRTLIDATNNVDAAVELKFITFDNIDVIPMIKGTFTHDFNGYGNHTVEEFCTVFGCDGTLAFEFDTPLSYWITKDYPY